MIDRQRLLLCAVLCSAPLALLACGDDSSGPAPVKHLYFSQDDNANGLFELNMTTGAATLVGLGNTATTSSTIGLTETASPATLLGSIYANIAVIAADGSGATVISGSAGVEALAMHTATGILYGCINGSCFTLDPVTGLNTGSIAAPGTDIEGLPANPLSGVIYGISGSNTTLYAYNVAGDAWSPIGDTGQNWSNPGLAYDHLAGVLYAVDGNTDALYTINPATAATALVGSLGTAGAGGLAFVVQ